jgi:hypothetical protein
MIEGMGLRIICILSGRRALGLQSGEQGAQFIRLGHEPGLHAAHVGDAAFQVAAIHMEEAKHEAIAARGIDVDSP